MADWKRILLWGGVENELEGVQATSRYSRVRTSHSRALGSGNESPSKNTKEWKRFILEGSSYETPRDSPVKSPYLGRAVSKCRAHEQLRKFHISKSSSSRTFPATRWRTINAEADSHSSSSDLSSRYVELEKTVRSRARMEKRKVTAHAIQNRKALEQRVSEAETELVSKFRASDASTLKSLHSCEVGQDSLMGEIRHEILSMENAEKLLNEISELQQVLEHRLEDAVKHELRKARELLRNEDQKLEERLLRASKKFQDRLARIERRKNALAAAALLLEEAPHFVDSGGHYAPVEAEKSSTLSRTRRSAVERNTRF